MILQDMAQVFIGILPNREMNEKGMLNPGDKIICVGFGSGLTWGATLIEWS